MGFEAEDSYNILANMLNGVAYCKMLYDNRRPIDFIYLFTNSAFAHETGLIAVDGLLASEITPNIQKHNPDFLEICGRVSLGGVPEKFEIYTINSVASNHFFPKNANFS